jgi:hypothetical protein
LLAPGEQDERPFHPLIRHVPVAPLPPDAVTGLDPADCLAGLRGALALSADGHHRAANVISLVPSQAGHGDGLAGTAQPSPGKPAAGLARSGADRD